MVAARNFGDACGGIRPRRYLARTDQQATGTQAQTGAEYCSSKPKPKRNFQNLDQHFVDALLPMPVSSRSPSPPMRDRSQFKPAQILLRLQGAGIVNNSTNVQTIVNSPRQHQREPTATATAAPTAVHGSPSLTSTHFLSNATAGVNVAIINEAGTSTNQVGGDTQFLNNSTAGSATITNNGATVAGAPGGFTDFRNTSSAGNATIVNNGGTNGGLAESQGFSTPRTVARPARSRRATAHSILVG